MDEAKKEAWAQFSSADEAVQQALRAQREANLALVEICKQEALANLEKYPQHAEIILGELLEHVINLLR